MGAPVSIEFGTDGWRAIIAEDFTFGNVRALAASVARFLQQSGLADRGLVVGWDTRYGSDRFAAAVADWRSQGTSASKIKKQAGHAPTLTLTENPDILSSIAQRTSGRPRLVIGFAAETNDVIANAQAKLRKKGCDWIVANDVSAESGVMGGDTNTVHLVTASGLESWQPQAKDQVARSLIERVAAALDGRQR